MKTSKVIKHHLLTFILFGIAGFLLWRVDPKILIGVFLFVTANNLERTFQNKK